MIKNDRTRPSEIAKAICDHVNYNGRFGESSLARLERRYPADNSRATVKYSNVPGYFQFSGPSTSNAASLFASVQKTEDLYVPRESIMDKLRAVGATSLLFRGKGEGEEIQRRCANESPSGLDERRERGVSPRSEV